MNNQRFIVFLFYFGIIAELPAQNPSPQWVMLFKNDVLAEEISVDGNKFAVLEQSNEGISDVKIFHFVSSNRKVIFKKNIVTSGKVLHVSEIFISNNSEKIAVTGISAPFNSPRQFQSLTIMFDAKGKELWRIDLGMVGFLNNGKSVLLSGSAFGKESVPCFRDEKEGTDYSCLRVTDASSGELKELITFPGHLGGFGFVYIWGENHVVIGSMEGAIFLKNIEDDIIWYLPGEGLIVKSILDKDKEVLVVERGGNDSVYDKKGKELWRGALNPEYVRLREMPEADLTIKFGDPILNKYQILFWKNDWEYQGSYKAQKDEINHLFHWDTFGQKFMRYTTIKYSREKKRAIARTMDRKKVDYFNFEIIIDPATANEP